MLPSPLSMACIVFCCGAGCEVVAVVTVAWGGDSGGGVVLAVWSLSAAAWLSHSCWAAAWVARVASVSGGGMAVSR